MKLSALIILFLITIVTYAQSVTGKVVDPGTGEEVIGTIVLLMDKSDTTKVLDAAADDRGVFKFDNVKAGTYIFKALFVGYKINRFEIKVAAEDVDLGTIKMEEDIELTSQVEIKATILMQRVEQKGDTTVINADAYKTNPDATTEDLVTKMPGVTVQSGEVKVNGESVKKVTVDGEEFFGNDALLVLRNLPADVVDKIQIYDRQSDQAKLTGFDDGNSQKTINIVTKAEKRNGQFGKVYAGYGTNDRYNAGLTLNSFKDKQRISLIGITNNINIQNFSAQDLTGMGLSSGRGGPGGTSGSGGGPPSNQSSNFLVGQQSGISATNSIGLNYTDTWSPKLKVSLNYFFNNTNNDNSSVISRQYFINDTASTIYNEKNISTTKNYNHRISGRIEYMMDSSNTFTYIPSISYQKRNVYQNLLGENRYVTDTLLSTTNNDNSNKSNNYSISNNLVYMHKFLKKGRTFSADLGSTINVNDVNTTLYSNNQYSDGLTSTRLIDQQAINNTHSYTYKARLMYTEPISKTGVLQFNYSPTYAKNDANKRTVNYNPSTGQYDSTALFLSNQLDNYTLTQKGGVGYRYNKGKLNFMAGADYQNVKLSSSQIFPYSNEIEKQFNNVLPMAMMRLKISDSSNIRMFYRSSTSIPGVNQLQNVVDNSNTLLLTAGNQNLKQEFTISLMVNYGRTSSKKGTNSMVFLNVSQTNNYIASSSFIATKDTVIDNTITLNAGSQLRRPVNLSGYWNANTFYTYGFPVPKIKSNLNLNTGITYVRTPGNINQVINISNAYGLNAGVGIASNISKKVDFNVTYNASYNIVENSIRPELNNNYFYHLAVAKVNVMPYKGLVLSTDLNERLYSGLSSSFNQQFLLWNASIGYKLLKDQALEVRVSVFDLLNQNRSISRTVTESYIQDTYTTVLTRYFMFTVTYNIKHFKASE
ncbi:outer membrane beta-barrel protein [Cytophaga aurantiaca]|uniref:outer membrane beta-barrel protein n=1 Tax=Cytophaga aurantiaca TaxID=29530 RepID=UPI00037E6536|nr:outer membrane beta-barrel protein [Cytophaga aurantiaca]